ncbi:MAG: hypothetical protein F6K41_33820 [Symploca sp. SIO3E6]|nr:hypothetical protein [Caldora sp. SIO3E6]
MFAQDYSEFIRDVTIPDGSLIEANETFTKIWEVRNAGGVLWKDRSLTRLGDNQGFGLITSPRHVNIPDTLPGQKVLIEVELKAPESRGTYQATWKMTFADGRLCFPDRYKYGLFVVINVP